MPFFFSKNLPQKAYSCPQFLEQALKEIIKSVTSNVHVHVCDGITDFDMLRTKHRFFSKLKKISHYTLRTLILQNIVF